MVIYTQRSNNDQQSTPIKFSYAFAVVHVKMYPGEGLKTEKFSLADVELSEILY